MSDDTSPIEDEASVDEIDTEETEDALLTTMESAPDEEVPNFTQSQPPKVEAAKEGKSASAPPGATIPGGTPDEAQAPKGKKKGKKKKSSPPSKIPISKRPTPVSGLPPVPGSKLPPRRSAPPSKLPLPPPRSKIPTIGPRSSPPRPISQAPGPGGTHSEPPGTPKSQPPPRSKSPLSSLRSPPGVVKTPPPEGLPPPRPPMRSEPPRPSPKSERPPASKSAPPRRRSEPPRSAVPGSTPPGSSAVSGSSRPPSKGEASADAPNLADLAAAAAAGYSSEPPHAGDEDGRPRSRPPGSAAEALDLPSSALKSSPPPDIPSFDLDDEDSEDDDEMDRPTLVHNPGTGDSSIEQAVETARRAAEAERAAAPPPEPPPPPPIADEDSSGAEPLPDPLGGDLPVYEEDDNIDLARTVKLERRSTPPSDAPEDEAPPEIPSISGKDRSSSGRRGRGEGRRRRSRRGKRRMVKIPDDNVPATPTPPAVEAAEDAGAADGEPIEDPTTVEPVEAEAGDVRESEIPVAISEAPPPPDDDDDEPLPGSTRQSAPGIFTDDAAIAVLRPIQVVSDLPAIEPEEAEEIEPEPDAPPGPPPARGAAQPPGGKKLPPPRQRLDSIDDDIEELVPEEIAIPDDAANALAGGQFDGRAKPPKPPPPRVGVADATGQQKALTPDELAQMQLQSPPATAASAASAASDAELAELRLREAEAKAREAEAKARAAAAKAEAARASAAQRSKKKAWWARLFEGELIQTLDNPRKRDVEKECDFIIKTLRLEPGARVLDLACGAGVHAAELSHRGYQVVGVDHSETMLELARAYNKQRGTSVSLIQGDMRQLSLEGIFDGIYCWGASFGYFDDAQNAKILERVCRALRPGGVFTLDVPNRDYVAPRAPHMAWFEKPGVVCMDEMRFDFYSSRMITKRMILFESGKSQELEMSMRLYTLTELGRLFHKVGLKVLEVSGHRAHRGAYFGAESPRTMITGRRREEEE